MQIDLSRFRDAFFEEAAEHVANLEAGLLRLEEAGGDAELLNDIFRAAHSIKGASGTFGFTDVASFTHALEGLLDRLRAGTLSPCAALVELLLRATDVLKTLIVAAKSGETAPPAAGAMTTELRGYLAAAAVPVGTSLSAPALAPKESGSACASETPGTTKQFRIVFAPGEDLLRQGMDPLLLLRDLAQLGEVADLQLDASRLPALEELDPESCYLSWTLRLTTSRSASDVRDVFAFVEDTCRIEIKELAPADTTQPARAERPQTRERRSGVDRRTGNTLDAGSIRVTTEKVDRLIDLVGEVVIAQSMLVQALHDFSMAKLPLVLEASAELERNTRELQERVMSIRMVPVGNIFGRFPRMVHDLAAAEGKKVSLEIAGAETELDKGVVEQISDPLTHLIRNAVDHGLESPADRLAAGKPEQGVVRLNAYHQGGNVIVEVADDGKGLDARRIREKAIAQELIKPDDVLTDEQTHMLIFHAGLSTAAVVTDVSGRGVGLDVVKRNIDGLNGTVSIHSTPGRGTTFRVKLPLTMAILDGLQLAVGDEIYVVPLIAIVESFRPAPADVRTVFGRGEVVMVRGEALPLLRLHRLLDCAARHVTPSEGLVVLLELEGQRFGLLVDELLGQSQVVIKSIEANYGKVDGVAGATILGDGRVAFILDIQGLLRLFAAESRSDAAA